jgi:hypothetical protein
MSIPISHIDGIPDDATIEAVMRNPFANSEPGTDYGVLFKEAQKELWSCMLVLGHIQVHNTLFAPTYDEAMDEFCNLLKQVSNRTRH